MPVCLANAGASFCIASVRSDAAATFRSCAAAQAIMNSRKIKHLRTDNHHLRGLDERRCDVAFFQPHLGDRICGDDAGDHLPGNGEPYLRHETVDFYLEHAANQLVAAADPAEVAPPPGAALDRAPGNKTLELLFCNAMVPAGRPHRAQLAA